MSKYPGNIVTTGADAGYSVFFDGTGDYLQSTTASLAGAFTIELWYYRVGTGSNYCFTVGDSFTSTGIEVYIGTSGTVFNAIYSAGAAQVTSTTQLPTANAWTHIALVRDGSNVIRCYLNGTQVTGSYTSSATFNSIVRIGAEFYNGSITGSANAYVSNFRVINGTALYTAAFTPPTQLLNITNTSLLTCNSPAIVDQSSNAFAITVNGNAAVSTFTPFAGYQAYNPALGAATPGIWSLSDALNAASTRQWNMYDPYFNLTTLKLSGTPVTNVPTWITDASTNNFAVTPVGDARAAGLSPFSLTTYPNSGSGYFDGTGDQLTIGNNTAFDPGSGNFTIECWVYLTGSSGSIINYSNGQTSNSNFAWEIYQTNTTSIQGGVYQGATGYTTSAAYTLNAWNHVALVRNGNALTIYVNGVAGATPANVTGVTVSSPAGSTIKLSGYNNGTGIITGYVSNVRIVKGVAVYTGNFTTPTAPLTATQTAGTNIAAITGTSTSLLTLQNSQSSNNNSFLDSSSNNFLITRSGATNNTTQGTFTPFSQTGWSVYLNGSSSLRDTSTSTVYHITGNFTVEGWYWFDSAAVLGDLFGIEENTVGWAAVQVQLTTSRTLSLNMATTSGAWAVSSTSTAAVTLGTWNHIAVTRSGSAINLWLNGVSILSASNSSALMTTGNFTIIGGRDSGAYITGYVSNFRFVNGTALYTSAFTPSTAPLTTTSQGATATEVELLTCQSNRFADNSSNNFTLTVTGTPSIQAFSPFQTNVAYTPATIGGSAYFDGATDELSMVDNAAFDLSSTDFTIEAWVYPTVINATNEICAQWGGVGNAPYLFKIVTAGRLQFVWTIGGGSGNTLTGTTVAAVVNQWNHVAVTRSGGTLSLFVNGVRDGTTGAITGAITNGTNPFYVGSIGGSEYLNGYMSGFRLIKGQALATTNFTPPTTPVNAAQVGWNGSTASLTGTVSALLNFTNGGIVDTTGKNVLETAGNVRISTTQSRYGGSSMYFDGSGDYLRFLNGPNQNFAFGTADFTIEGWIYLNSSSYQDLLDIYDNNSSGRILFSVNTSRQLVFSGASGATRTSTSTSIPLSTWTHFALCRASSSTRLFIGGVQGNTTLADTTNYTCTTGVVVIGINGFDLSSNPLNAYVNDWRISKFARYTGNFTPPTSLLQNQ